MLLNAFLPLTEIGEAVLAGIKRLWDRGFKGKYEKPDSDEINTKKVMFQEVENLYVGPEIKAFVVYSGYFTTFWGIMIFSSGLPALYLVGFATYFTQYWVYKYLLLKFYKKTVSFDDELPKFSILYFNIGILFHVLFALFVYTNTTLVPSQWEAAKTLKLDQH